MIAIEFQYNDYDIEATFEYDTREDDVYVGKIDFIVYNSQGEDVTCDIPNNETIEIHQEVRARAREEYDLDRGIDHGT